MMAKGIQSVSVNQSQPIRRMKSPSQFVKTGNMQETSIFAPHGTGAGRRFRTADLRFVRTVPLIVKVVSKWSQSTEFWSCLDSQ